jgi:cytochrome b561
MSATVTDTAATADRYSGASIAIHWATALLVAAAFATIELRVMFPIGSPERLLIMDWHYALGATVLGLTLVRLALRWRGPKIGPIRPAPPAWMHMLATLGHLALYAILIVLPILGWLTINAKGHPAPLYFGLELPTLLAKNPDFARPLEETHAFIGDTLYVVIGLHAVAALFHHYVMRDDTLRRMLPERKGDAAPAAGGR